MIASARAPHALARVVAREGGVGTRFRARRERLPARKAWIAFAVPSAGTLRINAGAVAALGDGRSLLSVGVTNVAGSFDIGDALEIIDESGALVAKGLTRVASSVFVIDEHEVVVVHRDDMVVLQRP